MEFKYKIIKILGKHKCVNSPNKIDSSTELKTLGIDSISFVKIIIELEEAFNISIPLDEIEFIRINTVHDVCKVLSKCINNNKNNI